VSTAIVAAEQANPRAIPRAWVGACLALVAVGVAAFAGGLATDPATAWRAFHVNYLYFGALAQGGVVVACAFVIIGARWPGPVRRIAEGLGAWVPLTFVLFLIGFIGREYIYSPWLHNPPAAKAAYLNPTRLFWMDVVILGWLAVATMRFLYWSVRPTLGGVAEGGTVRAAGLFRSWTRGWLGDAEEHERSARKLKFWAPVIALSYAVGWTFICFDQVMSLTPTWYSNLFGVYFCWGGFLSAVAATALLMVLHRNAPGLEGEISKARMHDIGKMIFAFSIFWMYLFFSQYLVIWYGNLPEETQFFEARLGSQFLVDKSGINLMALAKTWDLGFFWERMKEPYAKVTLFVWLCCWVTPFWVLLGQRPKKTPAILGSVGAVVLFGFWLERNILIWPSLVPKETYSFLGLVQLGVAAGFLGAFMLVFLIYTRVFPSLAVPRRA
jgi:hypothetical protein